MALFPLASVVLLLVTHITTTIACNGYELILRKNELCEGVDSILTLQNVSASLTEDCKITTTGCVTIKAFTTAKISYDILARSAIPLKGELDLCANLKFVPSTYMESLNLSTSCPVPMTSVCSNENTIFDISKGKDYLKLGEGTTRGEVKVTFDTGATCVIFDFQLKLKDGAKETQKDNLKELRKKFREMVKNRKAAAAAQDQAGDSDKKQDADN